MMIGYNEKILVKITLFSIIGQIKKHENLHNVTSKKKLKNWREYMTMSHIIDQNPKKIVMMPFLNIETS